MKRAVTLNLLICLLCAVASAQVTGVATLQGVVSDNSGAVVANAEVTVTNLETGVAVKAMTNEAGLYRVSALNPGRYSVETRSSGFAPTRVNEVRLEVGQTARLDLSLKIGNVSETVEVTAQGTLLNSETTDVGQVIDGKRIVETPLNGRNYPHRWSFNFTNTPAFGNPNTSLGTVNAGQINSAGDPRRIQFALKYVF